MLTAFGLYFAAVFTIAVVLSLSTPVIARAWTVRARQARLANGTGSIDDLGHLLSTRHQQVMSRTARARLAVQPGFGIAWLDAEQPWGLLEDCYAAGLTDNEIAAHLNGTNPISHDQVRVLLALR